MAIKDVKQYYYTMMAQYLEMKEDLADYEYAFKQGHITEDQLSAVKDDIKSIEQNYNRLTYVMFLLELPNKASKKKRTLEVNKNLEKYFTIKEASSAHVINENDSVLNHMRDELNKLIENDKKDN